MYVYMIDDCETTLDLKQWHICLLYIVCDARHFLHYLTMEINECPKRISYKKAEQIQTHVGYFVSSSANASATISS